MKNQPTIRAGQRPTACEALDIVRLKNGVRFTQPVGRRLDHSLVTAGAPLDSIKLPLQFGIRIPLPERRWRPDGYPRVRRLNTPRVGWTPWTTRFYLAGFSYRIQASSRFRKARQCTNTTEKRRPPEPFSTAFETIVSPILRDQPRAGCYDILEHCGCVVVSDVIVE